jgi:hypothetical protein
MHVWEKKFERQLIIDLAARSLDLGPPAFGLQDSFL